MLQIIGITPRLLAKIFWDLDSIKQAEFFQELFLVSNSQFFDIQMSQVGRVATKPALHIMHTIGKYGED